MTRVFTVGHSNQSIESFIDLLSQNGVKLLVDVRSAPGSRYSPQFAKVELYHSLALANIDYSWFQRLGGHRPKQSGVSPDLNAGWENASFRHYADYMSGPSFAVGLEYLILFAQAEPTAYMCAEAVPWRCHRTLISDALVARGFDVQHIMAGGKLKPHKLGGWGAKPEVYDTQVTYPSDQLALI